MRDRPFGTLGAVRSGLSPGLPLTRPHSARSYLAWVMSSPLLLLSFQQESSCRGRGLSRPVMRVTAAKPSSVPGQWARTAPRPARRTTLPSTKVTMIASSAYPVHHQVERRFHLPAGGEDQVPAVLQLVDRVVVAEAAAALVVQVEPETQAGGVDPAVGAPGLLAWSVHADPGGQELGEQLLDPAADLVSDRPHGGDALAGGVVEWSVTAAAPWGPPFSGLTFPLWSVR